MYCSRMPASVTSITLPASPAAEQHLDVVRNRQTSLNFPRLRLRSIETSITTEQRTNGFYIQSPRLQTAHRVRITLRRSSMVSGFA